MKKILLTGATKGIGKQIATLLASSDYELIITGRNLEQLQEISSLLNCKYIKQDLLEENAEEALFSKLNNIDILINNAGGYIWSELENTTLSDIKNLIKLNFEAPYKLSQLAIPYMKAQKWGRIINIGSISGVVGEANASLYSATKGAVVAMSKALGLELAEFGITINTINPGWVKTDLIEITPDIQAEIDCVPQRRFVEPIEVAKMVEYLLKDEARGITGQNINICAGLSLG